MRRLEMLAVVRGLTMGGLALGSLARGGVALGGLALGGTGAALADPYEATRARPLFAPTRRPPPPPAVNPQPVAAPSIVQPPPPPPALALSGVILGPGTSVALLSRPGSTEAMRVALGGRIDGWRLTEVRPRAVVLTLDDRHVTVALPDAASPSGTLSPQL